MFAKSSTEVKLEAEINALLDKLESAQKDSEEYDTIVNHLTALHNLTGKNRFKQISPDTVLIVAANIFGILWLTRFEREHVLPSRNAFSFIRMPTR